MALVTVADNGIITYRASGILNCERALVAARLGMTEMDPPSFMQRAFDEGHHCEALVAAMTDERDPELTLTPGTKDEPIDPIMIGSKVAVTGHVDGLASHSFHGACIVEYKAFAKSTWDRWRADHWEAFPYYAWQISIYMHGMGGDLPVLFVPGLKNTHLLEEGYALDDVEIIDIDPVWITEPLIPLNKIRARVLKIEALARQGLPDTCVDPNFPCPFWYTHDDADGDLLEDVIDTDDRVRITALATEYDAIREDEKMIANRKQAARDALAKLLPEGTLQTPEFKLTRSVSKYRKVAWDDVRRDHLAEVDLAPYTTTTVTERLTVTRKKANDR